MGFFDQLGREQKSEEREKQKEAEQKAFLKVVKFTLGPGLLEMATRVARDTTVAEGDPFLHTVADAEALIWVVSHLLSGGDKAKAEEIYSGICGELRSMYANAVSSYWKDAYQDDGKWRARHVPVEEEVLEDLQAHATRYPEADCLDDVRLAFLGGMKHRPRSDHALVVWLHEQLSSRAPRHIAEHLGSHRLSVLARSAIRELENLWPEGEGKELFEHLRRIGDTPDSPQVRDYWAPARILDAWIEDVDDWLVQGQDTSPKRGAPSPSRRIAWLFRNELGYTTDEIHLLLGPLPMQASAARFVEEYSRRKGTEPEAVRQNFSHLLGNIPTTELGEDLKPSRFVADWTLNIRERITREKFRQAKKGLGKIQEFLSVRARRKQLEPKEVIGFLFTWCLGGELRHVAKHYGEKLLKDLNVLLEDEFRKVWDRPKEDETLWFGPLQESLKLLPEARLRATFNTAGALVTELFYWRQKVYKRVAPEFVNGGGVPMFAARHNLWRDPGARGDRR